jgi:hypothetical protein
MVKKEWGKMTDENNTSTHDFHERKAAKHHHGGSSVVGSIYFMAFIGAAVYYIMQATTFWAGVLGFLKAIVWPAMLIFKFFEFLHM